MRVKAIGVQRMKGISKKTGAPFDFAQLLYLRKIEPSSRGDFSLTGHGYELGTLDLQIEALHKFNDVQFPCDLDLATEQVPGRNGIRSFVCGFSAQEKPKAVA